MELVQSWGHDCTNKTVEHRPYDISNTGLGSPTSTGGVADVDLVGRDQEVWGRGKGHHRGSLRCPGRLPEARGSGQGAVDRGLLGRRHFIGTPVVHWEDPMSAKLLWGGVNKNSFCPHGLKLGSILHLPLILQKKNRELRGFASGTTFNAFFKKK